MQLDYGDQRDSAIGYDQQESDEQESEPQRAAARQLAGSNCFGHDATEGGS
jgi:hypothetical protein